MIRAKIIGCTGYGGIGLVEILSRHEKVETVCICATQEVGKKISDVYPHLKGISDMVIEKPDNDIKCDVVFFSTPDGVGMTYAKKYFDIGVKIIDFSGDFRFNEIETYNEYAARIGKNIEHTAKDILPHSVYGLSELHKEQISKTSVAGNPGCFAVSSILGAAALVKEKLVYTDTLIFDAKTGISGAGKKPNDTYHYPNRYEQMNAYKTTGHQHVMEIEHELSLLAGDDIKITFTPQVFPIVRGIMTTIYAKVAEGISYQKIYDAYKSFYKNSLFVDIYNNKDSVGSRHVRGSNKAAIWINFDERTNTAVVISHIDNLMKGQASNAVQNMNVMFGFSENEGLTFVPQYP